MKGSSPEILKDAMARFVKGVTIVTCKSQQDGSPLGITVSAFCSASLEPPLVLICLATTRRIYSSIENVGIFAVNIVSAGSVNLAQRFAGLEPSIKDRFEGVSWYTAISGCPILTETLAWFDCEVSDIHPAGDHSIIVGKVLMAEAVDLGSPLIYFNRQWLELFIADDQGILQDHLYLREAA